MSGDGELQLALECYEEAVFGGDAGAIAEGMRGLEKVEADLVLARGRLLHARFLEGRDKGEPEVDERELASFERAAELYGALGDERGRAEALFWIGCYHQVVGGDHDTARSLLEESARLARTADDPLTLSYAVRHLGLADLAAGDRTSARGLLEESVTLRRGLGFRPGLAAGLVTLAGLSQDEGDEAGALALLDEAESLARDSYSLAVLRWIEAARSGS